MFQFAGILIFSLLAVSSPRAGEIEQAFKQNSVSLLYDLFPSLTAINISLPEPLAFSDQLSREQAYFLFKRIFASHQTYSFDVDDKYLYLPNLRGFILKARWSFSNIKNKNPFVFLIFFHMAPENQTEGGAPAGTAWRIFEIKAERI